MVSQMNEDIMIHQTPTRNSAEPMADWREKVAVGDIIRWPLGTGAESIDSIALVIDIETVGGWRVLTVAPGIDDVAQPVRAGTLRIVRLDEVRHAGLAKPVRFELARRISLAPQHPGLRIDAGSPIIGNLCEKALARLHAERARIHALRDIAAERRGERRAHRAHDRRTGWWHPARRPAAFPTGGYTTEDRA